MPKCPLEKLGPWELRQPGQRALRGGSLQREGATSQASSQDSPAASGAVLRSGEPAGVRENMELGSGAGVRWVKAEPGRQTPDGESEPRQLA